MKNIQLFTKTPSNQLEACEIDATLVLLEANGTDYHLIVKDEDGSKWEYYFPQWNVSMIRISKEE